MDEKSAFLNGYLDVNVIQGVRSIVNDMDGVIEKDNHVEVIQNVSIDVNDLEGFIVKDNGNIMIVYIYVEDIVFGGMSSKMVDYFVQQIQVELEISMVGELTYFICFQVKQMQDGVSFSQSRYAKNSLKKFGMEISKHKLTPASTHANLSKDEQGDSVD